MEKTTLNYSASGQKLKPLYSMKKFASDTVNYVEAVFDLDESWEFDSVRAIWKTDAACISTVLDQDGACTVPQEVLQKRAKVEVNLVGSDVEDDQLVDRLTTYPVQAFIVDRDVPICGTETVPITPSQFEQFIEAVASEVAKIKDISDVKLNADYTLTFLFSDGTEWTTPIPIRGEQGAKGETGNGISDIEKIGSQGRIDTYRITYTNGGHFDFEVTNGEKGEQGETGNGIESITLTATSGAVKTYTIAFTDGTSTTFDVTDGEVTNEVLDGATIVQTNTDKVPYLFRQSGGGVKVGLKESDKIVGGTVAWNQLVRNGNFGSGWSTDWQIAGSGTASVANGVLTCSLTSGGAFVYQPIDVVSGHKYLFKASMKASRNVSSSITFGSQQTLKAVNVTTSWAEVSAVAIRNGDSGITNFNVIRESGQTEAVDTSIKNAILIDLTAMFGSTIADYIYSLEHANAGAGVAWFKKLFPKDYYEYNAGELISVSGLESHDTVGFNQWDEEWEVGTINDETGATVSASDRIRSKNFIPCLPSTNYYFKHPNSVKVMFYDTDETFIGGSTSWDAQKVIATPSNCRYMKFAMAGAYGTTYKNDICINLSWPGYRNGEYEPYEKHSYPLDNSLTLRGIPKLDSSNNLYYDGDEYASDGSVVRKYGIRAYQSGDESLADAITDKTNTVYKLATPTTETAEPYQNVQICDDFGTEEFVSTSIVPVGHETEYPLTLIDTMPTANGTYTMSITVTNGKRTVNWA